MPGSIEELRATLKHLKNIGDPKRLDDFFTDQALDHNPTCCSIEDSYIYIMNEAGSWYRDVSNYPKSISCFEKLRLDMERFDMSETLGYATLLNNLAGSYRMAGDYESAEQYFAISLSIMEKLHAEDSFQYASALNNYSLCYQAEKKYPEALGTQQKAIDIMSQKEDDRLALATSYNNLANIYYALDNRTDALSAIRQSVALFQELDATDNFHYIGTLHTYAFLLARSGDYEESLRQFLNVLERNEAICGKNADYATALQHTAQIYDRLGDSEKAASCLREAYELNRQIFGNEHQRTKNAAALLQKRTEK